MNICVLFHCIHTLKYYMTIKMEYFYILRKKNHICIKETNMDL